jgi:hypothetical protein
MSSLSRPIDLTQVPAPWAWVDEQVYAAIRGCSVKVLQNERRLNIGCPFRRINGTTIRYRLGIFGSFWNRSLAAVVARRATVGPDPDRAGRAGFRLDCFTGRRDECDEVRLVLRANSTKR